MFVKKIMIITIFRYIIALLACLSVALLLLDNILLPKYVGTNKDVFLPDCRGEIKKNAEKTGVFGWARNASDGSVEAFIQGEDKALNDLLALCWEGPELAEVEDVLTQDSNVDESISSFDIH